MRRQLSSSLRGRIADESCWVIGRSPVYGRTGFRIRRFV